MDTLEFLEQQLSNAKETLKIYLDKDYGINRITNEIEVIKKLIKTWKYQNSNSENVDEIEYDEEETLEEEEN